MNYLQRINSEILEYRTKLLQIVPGLSYNQYDTLMTIYFYNNSKFMTGEYDAEGDKKYFYNISKNSCKVYTKMLDFDTKDVKIIPAGGSNPMKIWYMNRDLKYWMKDKKFGKILDRITKELPIYGSCVIKMVGNEPKFVDLRGFVMETQAETLDDSNFIIEIHNYSIGEFRKVAKQMGWKGNVQQVIDEWKQMKGRSHITVLERYGEVENEETGEWEYRRIYMADVGIDRVDQLGNIRAYNGVLLQSDVVETHPYWEFHMEKIAGRWLGLGVIETLFEPQIRLNEITNMQAKGSPWSALRLFQTKDQGVNRNLLSEVSNGEVLFAEQSIEPIDISDRGMQHFMEETSKWEKKVNDLTLDSPLLAGQGYPSGISAKIGIAQLLSEASKAYFDQIKKDIGLTLKDFIMEAIMPTFEQESTTDHVLRIVGEDLDELNEMLIREKAWQNTILYALQNKRIPHQDQFSVMMTGITAAVRQNKEKFTNLPRGFYKNLKYDLDIDMTGQSLDTNTFTAALFAGLQAMTADPNLLSDPIKRKFFSKWLEANNINPEELLKTNPQDLPTQLPSGVQQIVGNTGMGGGGVSSLANNQPVGAGAKATETI